MAREFHVRKLACALTSGVVLAAAAAAAPAGTTAMATGPAGQSPNAHKAASQYCQDFVGHLSVTLGVSRARAQEALTSAARQTVDDAVARGDLTSQQAQGMKSQLTDGSICSVNIASGARSYVQTYRTLVISAVAKAIGSSPEQVRTQLQAGKSVSEIAPKGMTEQDFATALHSSLKPELDAQVSAGKLTQSQENALLAHEPMLAQRLWTRGMPHPMMSGAPASGSPHAPSGSPSGP